MERGTVDTAARTVEISFSSERPIQRWWGIEVLSHKSRDVRMDRAKDGLPLLWNHDADQHIGILENIRLCGGKEDEDEKKGRGVARFSRNPLAEEKFRDVQDGILRDVSVGYVIHDADELKPEEMTEECKALSLSTQLPVYRVTDWEPLETSFVTIPADVGVGVGRNAETGVPGEAKGKLPVPGSEASTDGSTVEIQARGPNAQKEVRGMETDQERNEREARERAERQRVENDLRGTERARCEEIYRLCSKHGLPAFFREKHITDGTSIEEFRGLVLDKIGPGRPMDTPATDLGLTDRDIKRYSICRAILSLDPNVAVEAGFERECHEAISKRLGRVSKGIYVPYDVVRSQPATPRDGRRDLTVGTAAAGGYLVGTDHLGSEFIDILRNRMLIRSLGARVLSGLKGNVVIPRRTAGAATGWVTEGNAPSEGSNTFGQLSLSPRNIAANVDYTRNLLLHSNPSVDALVNGDLAVGIALGVDKAAFHGAGTAEPVGVENTAGIGAVTGTTIAWAGILEFESDVAGANADAATCAYVTTPAVRALLKQRVKFSSTNSPLWEDGGSLQGPNGASGSGRMNGYRAEVSNQIEAATLFFGDFSQILLAEWGVLELLVDPYTQSKAGIIQVTAFQTVDVGVRYPAAFSMAQTIT